MVCMNNCGVCICCMTIMNLIDHLEFKIKNSVIIIYVDTKVDVKSILESVFRCISMIIN